MDADQLATELAAQVFHQRKTYARWAFQFSDGVYEVVVRKDPVPLFVEPQDLFAEAQMEVDAI